MSPWLWNAEEVVDYLVKIPYTAQIFSAQNLQRAFIEHDVTGMVLLSEIFNRSLLREEFGITSLDSHSRILTAVKDLRSAAKELGFDQYRQNMRGIVEGYIQTGHALPLLRDQPARISPTPSVRSESLHPEHDDQVSAEQSGSQTNQSQQSDQPLGPVVLMSVANLTDTNTHIPIPLPLISKAANSIELMPQQRSPPQLPTPLTISDRMEDGENDVVLQDADSVSDSGHHPVDREGAMQLVTRKKPVSLFNPSDSQQQFMAASPQFSAATSAAEGDQLANNGVPETAPASLPKDVVEMRDLQKVAGINISRRRKPRYLQMASFPIDDIFYGVYPDIENENFFQGLFLRLCCLFYFTFISGLSPTF